MTLSKNVDLTEGQKFPLNAAQLFKNTPKRSVSRAGTQAYVRPSPSDIPNRIEIVVKDDLNSIKPRSVIIARLSYPSDSEPQERTDLSRGYIFSGAHSGRVSAVEVTLDKKKESVDFKHVLQALKEAISDAGNTAGANDFLDIRKDLNREIATNVFGFLLMQQNSDSKARSF